MNTFRLIALGWVMFVFSAFTLIGQEAEKIEKKGYEFTLVKEVPNTAVPNQFRSGTCWSFSGLALIEAEILRTTGKTYNLSEMFVVHHAYSDKAKKYVRLHGNLNLGAGGGFSDVLDVIKRYGMIPEKEYSGLVINEENHTHGEMDEVLKAYADAVIKNANRRLTPVWHQGFESLLDTYLGSYPDKFVVDGKVFTPITFAESTGINADDYIEITSFTHCDLYKPFIMEIPDNWMWSETYNLPLNELLETLDHALENGYTVAWGADVSEKGFSWKNGLAVVPEDKLSDMSGTEKERWEALTPAERQKAIFSFDEIVVEKTITPEMRQMAYDNYETTDDHGMLFVGIARDQKGNKYYKVKNSWGTEDHKYVGYLFASVPFVQYKTINMVLHKDALPKHIRKKLGL
ncbi:MAG: C1 family peptidase [Bacteroidales bacterium]|nr:C1 family peptidase [Bacteroidales bacterium]